MITFIAVLLAVCCGLVILIGSALSSQLSEISYDVTIIKENVNQIYREQPYNSWFTDAYKGLNNKLDGINDHLTTEIACLATKNNEDIKRIKDGYAIGDILEFDGDEWYVFGKGKLDTGVASYNIFNKNGEDSRLCSDDWPKDLKLIGHIELPFGAKN